MKAVIYTKYGPPEVLQLRGIEKPTPKDSEVLIKIRATTVNRTDCGFRRPEYLIVRFISGLFRPKKNILGSEMAGEIDRSYPLEQIIEATRYVESGQKTGNVVITI